MDKNYTDNSVILTDNIHSIDTAINQYSDFPTNPLNIKKEKKLLKDILTKISCIKNNPVEKNEKLRQLLETIKEKDNIKKRTDLLFDIINLKLDINIYNNR